jgi:NTE family protein
MKHPSEPPGQTSTAVTAEQLAARGARKPVNLALQGGGSHGAFTWGVLDRLLEDGRLAIEAASATSAGAMNAVAMAHGVSLGGPEGGRAKLEEFWRAVSRRGQFWPSVGAFWKNLFPFSYWLPPTFASAPSPGALWLGAVGQIFSPYDLNPLDYNPLKDALKEVIDFEHLQRCQVTARLFLCATNVRSGKIKVFENPEITIEAVLASACLPNLFKAVEVGGEAYWDGGYMGNPAIFPLIYKGASRDVIVVHINPLTRAEIPRTAADVRDRENEITFNSSLMREMRAIAFVSKLMEEERLDANRYRRMLVHAIMDEEEMRKHDVQSKYSADWDFLVGLRDAGRRAAEAWLAAHYDDIGERSTAPIQEMYL